MSDVYELLMEEARKLPGVTNVWGWEMRLAHDDGSYGHICVHPLEVATNAGKEAEVVKQKLANYAMCREHFLESEVGGEETQDR